MTRSSLIASAFVLGLIGATPTVSSATDALSHPNLEIKEQAINFQDRWLGQFGANARIEPLCPERPGEVTQVLSPTTCSVLAQLYVESVPTPARSVRVSQIKRNRAIWHSLSHRDQRILEKYEIVVVGQARAVEAKTSGPR
jgi:hypothetical protein